MKNAFTIFEFIAVVLIVGILSIVMLPRLNDNRLREAADQIISHIRYTQHLAMIDDRYNPNDKDWFKERWQIGFWQCANGNWYYIIGHDLDHGGGIGKSESAINPLDKKHLFTSNGCTIDGDESREILLTEKYGINDINLSKGCGNNHYIAFDNIGRPYKSTLGANVYDVVNSTCTINFTSDNGNFSLTIAPETGYVQLSSINY
jgi:type II secretory pathway pseudopilin PulG